MPDEKLLRGTVEKVLFSNPENGYAVCALTIPGQFVPVKIMGSLDELVRGDAIEAEGSWEKTKHGSRFAVASYTLLLPTTPAGIERYLASRAIKGIGKVTAARIVARFGAETISVLDDTPDRLREVKGLGRQKIETIVEAWQAKRGMRNLRIFLQSVGLSDKLAPKIMRGLGANAVRTIRENPYELALRVTGIGFLSADRVARHIGVPKDSLHRAAAGVLHVLTEAAGRGHCALPLPVLVEECLLLLDVDAAVVEPALPALAEEGRIVIDRKHDNREPYVFLKPLWEAEARLTRELHRIAEGRSALRGFDRAKAAAWLSKRRSPELTAAQTEAVLAACTDKVVVITGGPGTGKTTILRAILDVLDVLGGTAVLAAPTGRAAKRMSETTGREAKTIHRMLAMRPGASRGPMGVDAIEASVVILDEASMIDLPLMAALAEAVPSTSHLVLVGDADQLPSVGPGEVLHDLIGAERFRVVRLTEIFRQSEESLIVANAYRILRGETPIDAGNRADADFYFFQRDNPAAAMNTIVELAAEKLPAGFGIDPMNDLLVLSPMHKGDTGVKALNRALQERLNPSGAELRHGERIFRFGDRVLQMENDYDRDIFNGDMGHIVHVDAAERALIVDFDGRRVRAEGSQLDTLQTAYAISIHKSQGSEVPAVIIALSTYHFVMLQRNLLYTAVTRAKRLVVIVGSRRALDRAIENRQTGRRFGLLRERLLTAGDARAGGTGA